MDSIHSQRVGLTVMSTFGMASTKNGFANIVATRLRFHRWHSAQMGLYLQLLHRICLNRGSRLLAARQKMPFTFARFKNMKSNQSNVIFRISTRGKKMRFNFNIFIDQSHVSWIGSRHPTSLSCNLCKVNFYVFFSLLIRLVVTCAKTGIAYIWLHKINKIEEMNTIFNELI